MIAPPPPPPLELVALATGVGPAGPCFDALVDVLGTRRITAQVPVTCPATDDQTWKDGRPHQGLAWVAHDRSSAWVAVHTSVVANPALLRFVMAHELCHVAYGLTHGDLTERTADACASDLGFRRP